MPSGTSGTSGTTSTSSASDLIAPPRDLRIAALQSCVLALFCLAAFRTDLAHMVATATYLPDAAHLFAAPILIAALLAVRRRELAAALGRGSIFGFAILAVSLAVFVLSSWPFNYAYPRRIAIVPALAGCVLAVGGWRFLRHCLPALLILLIAIPTGSRYYAFLIIKPETFTMQAVQQALDLLPGVFTELQGPDLVYDRGGIAGTIALGVPNRGASLFLAFLTLGVFVTFVRIRPVWQILGMAIVSIPILLIANFLRVLLWGLITIYTNADPLDSMPRTASTVLSIGLAYLLFVAALGVMKNLVKPDDAATTAGEPQGA